MPGITALRAQVEADIKGLDEVRVQLDKEADEVHRTGVMIRWASFVLAIAAVVLSAVSGATGLGDIWSKTTIAVLSLVAAVVIAVNTAITATSKAALTRRYKKLGSVLGYDARVRARIGLSNQQLSSIGSLTPPDQENMLRLLEHETKAALDSANKFVEKVRTTDLLDDLEQLEVTVRQ